MPFYNTNAEQGDTLAASNMAAEGQEGLILTYFKRRPTSERTRRDIELIFRLPTQSATRALRNLTAAGYLEKSPNPTVKCEWSKKMVHIWRLAKREPPKPPKQDRLF